MRILSIGTDRKLFEEGSASRMRHEAYAKQLGALDVIVFARGDGKSAHSGALSVTPTNSFSRLLYGLDAFFLARTLPKPDAVTVQDPFETGFFGWLVARHFGVPLHVQVHTDFLSPEYARLSFLNHLRVWIAGFVLRHATGIRVVSNRIKENIQEHYRLDVPITVLPIFVDVGRFRDTVFDAALGSRFRSFTMKVLVVSRLEREKNVQLALRAFAASAPPDSCLIVAGTGNEEISFKHFAKRLNVAERVFFEGPRDVAPYYKLADVVLVPSRYEGYGLVIIEALAAGKPVLSTDVGIAREAGAIVTTEEGFADALSEWFKNGPREGHLKSYPYKDFDEYARAYCDDIVSCIEMKKRHTTAL